mmetsp:Transcript_22483/g.43761  ORF Transcript_22483/g.43761 Transcript_22483/m.43761 type:complete len:431 (-) Transcript_22483:208-1500(-)
MQSKFLCSTGLKCGASRRKKEKSTELKAILTLPFLNTLSLYDLKCALYHHPSQAFTKTYKCPSIDHMRVFTLKDNLSLGAPFKSNFLSLLQMGVMTDGDIAVEILREPEKIKYFSQNAIAVKITRCYLALDAEAQILEKRATKKGTTPPKETKTSRPDEQARKKLKLAFESSRVPPYGVFGPIPPTMHICDGEGVGVPPVEMEDEKKKNVWLDVGMLQSNTKLVQNLDLSKMPNKMEQEFISVLKKIKPTVADMSKGSPPSLRDLRTLCSDVSGIPAKDLVLLKWYFQGQRWHILTPDLKQRLDPTAEKKQPTVANTAESQTETEIDLGTNTNGEGAEKEGGGGTNDSMETEETTDAAVLLTSPPFSFREGEFVAVLSRRDFPGNPGFSDLEAFSAQLGPRAFITSRKIEEPADKVQKFPQQDQQLKIYL